MTKISRSTIRETAVLDRGLPLIVELLPKFLSIHRKGMHGGVNVSYDAIYELGLKLAARRER